MPERPYVAKSYYPLVVPTTMRTGSAVVRIPALSPLYLTAAILSSIDPGIMLGLTLHLSFYDQFSTDISASFLWTVSISDDRTFCLETNTSGPCSTRVTVGAVFGQFNPGCPKSTFVFAQDSAQVVWQPPKLLIRGTTSLSLSSIHQSGESFPIGTTLVEYADMSEPYQSEESRFRCSFNVCDE